VRVVRRAPVDAELRVVIPRRDGEREIGVARKRRAQNIINVTATSGESDAQPGHLRDRALDERARLEQVQVGVPVRLLPELARAHLDQPARQIAVARAEVPRDEVDRLEQVRIERAGERGEVVEERDRLAVEIDDGIARLAAADHQRAAPDGARARDARQILDDLQRVSLRSRNPLGLLLAHGGPGDLGALPFSLDGRLEGARVQRLQPVLDLQLLPGGNRFARDEAFVPRRGDDDLHRLAFGNAAKLEAALPVGGSAPSCGGDLDARQLAARAALADAAGEVHRQLFRARWLRRGRRREIECVLDADGDRLTAAPGRIETELPGGRERRFVEPRLRLTEHQEIARGASLVDVELQNDAGAPAGPCRVLRRHFLDQLGRREDLGDRFPPRIRHGLAARTAGQAQRAEEEREAHAAHV